jgi:hypothetical protein
VATAASACSSAVAFSGSGLLASLPLIAVLSEPGGGFAACASTRVVWRLRGRGIDG